VMDRARKILFSREWESDLLWARHDRF